MREVLYELGFMMEKGTELEGGRNPYMLEETVLELHEMRRGFPGDYSRPVRTLMTIYDSYAVWC